MEVPTRLLRTIFIESSRKTYLWAVFALALLVRLCFVVVIGDTHSPMLYEHGEIAHNLYVGNGFSMHWPYESLDSARRSVLHAAPTHEGAFLPPLNPYLMLIGYQIFGETSTAFLFLMLLYSIIGSACAVVAYYATVELASDVAARIVSIFLAIFLPAAFAVTTFSGSVLYHLLGLLIVLFLLRSIRRRSLQNALILGLLTGTMVLVRSEFFLLGFVLIVVAALPIGIKDKTETSRRISLMLASVLTCAVVVAPWTYRNYVLFDQFVPVLSHPWYEMWRGNNLNANGSTTSIEGRTIWVVPSREPDLIKQMDAIAYDRHFEPNVDRIFQREVLHFITDHPTRFIQLGAIKLLSFFTIDFHSRAARNPANVVSMMSIVSLVVAGFWLLLRSENLKHLRLLFGVLIAYYLALTVMTVILSRYQIYVYVMLLPLGGITVDALLLKWARVRPKTLERIGGA